MNIAIYGGSFNPPHIAHAICAQYAISTQNIDKVIVVPCNEHAFDKDLMPFRERLQMCEYNFENIKNVEVSDVENQLGGRSYTIRTLQYFKDKNPNWNLYLIVGADIVDSGEIKKWKNYDEIEKLAKLIVMPRPKFKCDNNELLPFKSDVSSTLIRELISKNNIKIAKKFLHKKVYDKLYKIYG